MNEQIIIGPAIQKETLVKMVLRTIAMGGKTFQFFAHDPKADIKNDWKFTKDDINKAKELIDEYGIIPTIHSTYSHDFTKEKGIVMSKLLYELDLCEQISGSGVVIHITTRACNWSLGLINNVTNNFFECVKEMKKNKIKARILFETLSDAIAGSCFSTVEHIRDLVTNITNKGSKDIDDYYGICVDMCHINILKQDSEKTNTKQKMIEYFKKFSNLVSISHLKLIHFNDIFSYNFDKHGIPFIGRLTNPRGGGDPYVFIILMQIAKKYQIPLIIETHKLTNMQYVIIIGLIRVLCSNIDDDIFIKATLDEFYSKYYNHFLK